MKKIIIPGLVAGLVMLIVGFAVTTIVNMVSPNVAAAYQNTAIIRPWSDPLMMAFFLQPFILGIAFAWVWNMTKGLIKDKNPWRKGAIFGLSVWAITGIPGMYATYTTFQVPLLMVLSWLLGGLLQAIVAGWIFVRMNE